jgi:ubiquinone/menaquinone biosynthesis C-methylase UbiE
MPPPDEPAPGGWRRTPGPGRTSPRPSPILEPMWNRVFLLVSTVALPLTVVAAPPLRIDMAVDRTARIPPAATHFRGREIAQTMHYPGAPWLMRESRQREEDCRLLLEALAITPGQRICDLGCGNGFYTLELARRVGPEGLVYAVDIQPEMLRMLARRAAEAGLTNIRPILGTAIDPRLPEGDVDLVLCVDVYHEFSHPEQMLARIRESLADGGQVVLAEFRGEDPAVPIKPLHKMTKAQVRAELEPAGFRLVREFDRLPWQHLLFFAVEGVAEPVPAGE